jgi:hypothetical protein
MRISIPQPGCCPVRLLGSRASASEVLRATRDSSHAFEVFPAVDNAPPELAVDGAVPAQLQLRQRARRQSQDLGGLTGGQRDRIVSRHQSLTTNQPDPPGDAWLRAGLMLRKREVARAVEHIGVHAPTNVHRHGLVRLARHNAPCPRYF